MSRGGLFNSSDSSSWSNIGNYSMGLEMNLGYSHNATYGHDTVALGVSKATGSPNLDSQVVATFDNDDYYVGLFGMGHRGTDFSEHQHTKCDLSDNVKGAKHDSKSVMGLHGRCNLP